MDDELERGRAACARRAWADAHESLARADAASPLGVEDVELLSLSAYMLGRDDESMALLERAHQAHLDAGATRRAVRCAMWICMHHAARGEMGPAGGWLARSERLLGDDDCAERGYFLIPAAFGAEAAGDLETAAATAAAAAEVGQRFGDPDLYALATHTQGRFLVGQGRVDDGFRLLDEAMVAATSGSASPIVTGLVYCGVILACVEVLDVRRAREWTEVLTRWCEEQPGLVAFTGRCLVHRAEILQLHGAWPDALDEARRAAERLVQGFNRAAAAQAFYRQGEVHRLSGRLDEAEEAYAASSRHGWEPQPGLALLRLAQGRPDAAGAAIRRVLAETTIWSRRAVLLPARVEIALALGEVDEAREAARELDALSTQHGSAMLQALAATALAAVHLAAGGQEEALAAARRASEQWRALEAPYEEACARVAVGIACAALGDDDTAALELSAARATFAELGATPDLARVRSQLEAPAHEAHGLTERELEVLRLVAAGDSNRAIASALVISEHTVARHLQNIFRKLDVSSRTAASAFAYEHDLV
ncbi:MAG TPA: LuxR C-terminal-related transcriptional regulator [Gaiella sp.]